MATGNPPKVPLDTTADVWRRQMAAIADRSMSELLDEWEQLNRALAQMEADGILRRHPDYDDQQVVRAAARLRYGDTLVRAAWPDEQLLEP